MITRDAELEPPEPEHCTRIRSQSCRNISFRTMPETDDKIDKPSPNLFLEPQQFKIICKAPPISPS